jgi:hypothetical protein
MFHRKPTAPKTPAAARVYSRLEADDALLPGEASVLRKSSAVMLALLVLAIVPLYLAANAVGVIGDTPAAIAKSGPGHDGDGEHDDDSNSGPGSGDGDDSDTRMGTDDTSANGTSTRGTTDDNDTRSRTGTRDTSANGDSTRGTTGDDDTRSQTGTGTQTRTRSGS